MSLLAATRVANGYNAYLSFRRGFAELIDPRRYSLEWLDSLILSGAAQVWASDHACIVTELRRYPTGAQDIHGLGAVGDMGEIVGALIPQAENWARGQGCIGAVIESRKGWARALHAYGYEAHQQTVRKEL